MGPSVLIMVSSMALAAEAVYLPCRPCRPGENCDVDPSTCNFGTAVHCNRLDCARGPGERCGVYKGKCAKNLYCNDCGFCSGCFFSEYGETCFKSDMTKCYG